MDYLVLKPTRELGVSYKKGDIISSDKIRSVRYALSSGKIIPAVSSQNIDDEGELLPRQLKKESVEYIAPEPENKEPENKEPEEPENKEPEEPENKEPEEPENKEPEEPENKEPEEPENKEPEEQEQEQPVVKPAFTFNK